MLRTPLHQHHLDHGAQMVEFAGWEMPIMYRWPEPLGPGGGIHDEHRQVRASGGFFDVSHMGRVRVRGRHARRLVERLCTRRIVDMQPGQCRYSLMCNESGGVRDDVLVYRVDDDDFLIVVNAANREKLLPHFDQVKGDLVATVEDRTLKTAMVAIQGPRVMDVISNFSREIPTLKRYRFVEKNFLVMKLLVSRTGYTGEDGVEVILPANMTAMAMKMLMKDMGKVEAESGIIPVKPAGLGCRDTLRLEAGMALYGHELGEEINALASGLDFAMDLDKDADERGEHYIGCQALKSTRDSGGPATRLVGLFIEGRRTARPHMKVCATVGGKERQVGGVTSACLSPTLERCIAMAYVGADHGAPGTRLVIETGRDGKTLDAEVAPLPFYKKPKKKKD